MMTMTMTTMMMLKCATVMMVHQWRQLGEGLEGCRPTPKESEKMDFCHSGKNVLELTFIRMMRCISEINVGLL